MNKYSDLYFKAKEFKYISVDIYDTLIYRAVRKPNDVFEIVESIINKELNRKSWFYKKRLMSERMARKNSKHEDINIDKIYECMDASLDEKRKYKEIEEKVEFDLAIPNRYLINEILKLQQIGCKIIITTDMYLPKNAIEKVLSKTGIDYDWLFISGEVGLTKDSGKLYSYVLKNLNIKNTEIMHIGNDLNKDIVNANKNGISAYYVDNAISKSGRYLKANKKLNVYQCITKQYIYNSSSKDDTFIDAVGYSCLGPFLVGFCNWINRNKKNNVLWFVAREGYLVKSIYEILYPEDSAIIKYVRLNKNILREPVLAYGNSPKDFLATIPECKTISIDKVLRYLSASEDIYNILDINYGEAIHKEFLCNDLESNNEFNLMFSKVMWLKSDSMTEQAELLEKYIFDNTCESKEIAFINNSIHGNGQFLLEKILSYKKSNINVTGMQFVMSNRCKEKKMDCRSWLNEMDISLEQQQIFDRNSLVFEHMLFENIGTSIKLINSMHGVEAVCKTQNRENENDNLLNRLQSAAQLFAKNYKSSTVKEYIEEKELVKPLLQFLEYPILEDVCEMNSLFDDNDIGNSNSIVGIEVYKYKKNNFKLNQFMKTGWRQGYMVACGLGNNQINIIDKLLFCKSVKDGYYLHKKRR